MNLSNQNVSLRNPKKFALLVVPLLRLSLLAACGTPVEGTPGAETSSCNDGRCLVGLECRSDLCVDPQWEPTGADSGVTTDVGPTSGTGGDGMADGQGSTTDEVDTEGTEFALELSSLLATPPYCLQPGSTLLDLIVDGSGDSTPIMCDHPDLPGSGFMPEGVSVNPQTCELEGTPTDPRYGTQVFIVRGTQGQTEVWAPYCVTTDMSGDYAIDVEHGGLMDAAVVPQLHYFDPDLPLQVGASGDPLFVITDPTACGSSCFFGWAFSISESAFDSTTFELTDSTVVVELGGFSHGLHIEGPAVDAALENRPWTVNIALDYCLAEASGICDGAPAVRANGRGSLDFSLLMVPE